MGSPLGTLETFLFLVTFLCLESNVRESSWLMFSLPFPPVCYISGKELTGLKGWVQVEEKASLSFIEDVGEYGCFHQTAPLLWLSCSGTHRTQVIISAGVYLGDLLSPPPRPRKSGGKCASGLVTVLLGVHPPATLGSAQFCALGSLNYVYSGGQHQRFIASNKSCSKLTGLQTVSGCNQLSVS